MSLIAFPRVDRYRFVRRLGEGGMGVVFEAVDEVRGGRVALKTLRESDSNRLYGLKREFRALSDLSHPNLVRLYDLSVSHDSAFFTMELIEGVDLLTYCRDAPGFDEKKLRHVFGQLATGLVALHEAGLVHRDVKPFNVLVTPEGRLVLLDFGLVANLSRIEQVTFDENLVGTALYMSPEQARGEDFDEAADWYSVGAMLYQALTGRPPHEGTALQVLQIKQEVDPPSARSLNPQVSPELDALCMALLSRSPSQRPTGRMLIAQLADTTGPTGVMSLSGTRPPSVLIGRQAELALLERCLGLLKRAGRESSSSGAVSVLLQGESGVGKTALIRHFLDELALGPSNTVVLEGRCYDREAIPYKAVDGLIDALSSYWKRLPRDEQMYLLPREPGLLQRLFPVLGRVAAVAAAAKSSKEGEVEHPQEFRRRAFAALREVLQRLSVRGRLVLVLDDLQWVDVDTVALLTHVFQKPDAPSALVLLCSRKEGSLALEDLLRSLGPDLLRHALSPLAEEDARALGEQLLGPQLTTFAPSIAREAQGNPFFVGALTQFVRRVGGHTKRDLALEDVLSAWVASLSENAKRLLELLCVAGEPLPQQVVAAASGLGPEQVTQELHELVAQHMVRFAAASTSRLEPYHDRIREGVIGALSAERAGRHHQALAFALEKLSLGTPVQLARHWHAAGSADKAAHHALTGGDQAAAGLAFDQAAALYRIALECLPVTSTQVKDTKLKLAKALAHGGRGTQAADVYLELATDSSSTEYLELRRQAFEQLLINGHVDRGMTSVSPVLSALGMRLSKTPRGALTSLWLQRVRLSLRGLKYRERSEDEIPKVELTRIDTCWSVGVGLAMTDHIRGAEFHTRSLLLALDAGEPYRISRAMAFEGIHLVSIGDTRAMALIESAKRLAQRLNHPHAIAFATLMQGVGVYLEGQFTQGLEHFESARQQLIEHCPAAIWERATAELYSLWCLGMRGDFTELALRVPRLIQQAQERGNSYSLTNLRTGIPALRWLVADDPERARNENVEAMSHWSQQGFHMQHFFELLGLLQADLYSGDAVRAYRDLQQRWPMLEASKILSIRFIRINLTYLRGCVTWGAFLQRSPERSQLLKEVEKLSKALADEGFEWPVAWAEVLEASCAQARGESGRAERLLAAAEKTFRGLGMNAYAAAALRRRGETVGGPEGARLVNEADSWLAQRGVVRPDRLAAMLVPALAEKTTG